MKAIQTPNTVIVLDEISRAHPEAHNILMTVLDAGQRYLRLDEAADSPVVKVADGVSFIASANIGNEYTSTRQLDRAIVDRFTIIEMDTLTIDEESSLLQMMYPSVDENVLNSVANITTMTRNDVKKEVPTLSNSLSTRTAVEIGSLLYDGFNLAEAGLRLPSTHCSMMQVELNQKELTLNNTFKSLLVLLKKKTSSM